MKKNLATPIIQLSYGDLQEINEYTAPLVVMYLTTTAESVSVVMSDVPRLIMWHAQSGTYGRYRLHSLESYGTGYMTKWQVTDDSPTAWTQTIIQSLDGGLPTMNWLVATGEDWIKSPSSTGAASIETFKGLSLPIGPLLLA